MSKKLKKAEFKPTIYDLASGVIVLIAFITVIYYMLGPSEGYLQSDCVDTMTWAGATIDSGKLFSDTFYYPYLLPFGATFTFYPFMKLFGFTRLAFRLTMLFFMFTFSAAIYFTARGMKWSRKLAFIAVSLELITVSSSIKLRELFWEHIIHYSLGAFLAFTLLALTFYFMRSLKANNYSILKNKKTIIFAALIFLWSYFSAFDGLTTLALSSIPVIGSLVITAVLDLKQDILSKQNKDNMYSAVFIILGTILGSVTLSVLAKEIGTGYGNAYSVIANSSEWSNNAMKFLSQWTSLLGADYKIGESITKSDNIFAAVKLAASLIIFLMPVYAMFIYNKLNKYEQIFVLFHWLMTAFILYGYVFGNLSSVNWRLSPIICSALMVNVITWRTLWNEFDLKRVSVILSSLIVLGCAVTVGQIFAMPSDYGRDDDHHKAIELLEKNNLNYGYATYWNANLLTLLSDSRVEVRDVNVDEDYPRNGWLNCDRIWFDDQEGQDTYFFLLSNNEYQDLLSRNHVVLEDTDRIISEGNWVVLVKSKNLTFN